MSWLTKNLGVDKSAAEKSAKKDQESVGKTVAGLVKGDAANYEAAQGQYAQTIPLLGGAFGDLSKTTTQEGRDGLVADFGARQTAAANDAAAAAGHAFNLSPDLARGYALDAKNQANTNTASYAQSVNSPEEKLKSLLAFLHAGTALRPDASGLVDLSNLVMNNPAAVHQDNGVLGGLASLLGAGLGSGLFSSHGLGNVASAVGQVGSGVYFLDPATGLGRGGPVAA